MPRELIVALTLLAGANSAALAASYHHYGSRHGYYYGARHGYYYVPRHRYYYGWRHRYGSSMPNDTTRSFDYQQDMGAGSGKPGY